MEYFVDRDCGKTKQFKTTHGIEGIVNLEFDSDGTISYIALKSPGRYRMKIGWKYSGIDNSCNELTGKPFKLIEIDEYCTKERVMSTNEKIMIHTGWDAKYSFGKEYDYKTVECFPFRIDILDLIFVD